MLGGCLHWVRQRKAGELHWVGHEITVGGVVLCSSEQCWQEGFGDRCFHGGKQIGDAGHRALKMDPFRLSGPRQHAIRRLGEPYRGLGEDADKVSPEGGLLCSISTCVVMVADVASVIIIWWYHGSSDFNAAALHAIDQNDGGLKRYSSIVYSVNL